MKIHVKLHGLDYAALSLDNLTINLLLHIENTSTLHGEDHLHFLVYCAMLRIAVLRQSLIRVYLIVVLHLLAAFIKLHR